MALVVGVLLGPVVTALCIGVLGMLGANLLSLRRLRPGRSAPSGTTVSVLVPARNEEALIERCLASLVAQDHEHLEVIVLDDRSDDRTAAIARSFADRGVRTVDGEPLPEGWTGKNWACTQLARAAGGEVLCFVDADTALDPRAVSAALALLEAEDAGLVTLLSASEERTFAQAMLLPIINHALMALFPVWLMHRTGFRRVAVGIGPFMMVQGTAYDEVGGHAAAPAEIVDDVALSRAIKGAGHPVRLANGTALVRTCWYERAGEIWRGFSKNAFGAIDANVALTLATVFVFVPLLCAPFVRVLVGLLARSVPVDAVVQVALVLAARLITSVAGRDRLWALLLHPVALVVWAATLFHSMVLTLSGSTIEWRGRGVEMQARGG